MSRFVVCALYKFVRLDDHQALRTPLYDTLVANQVRGTLLLASEGINGTIAGSRTDIDAVLDWLHGQPQLADIVYKESLTDTPPFKRTRVKLKKEIVTMGVPGIDPTHVVGTYVSPQDWNALISDPDVLLIDTRNDYEVQVGTFRKAINPGTDTFREFPRYVKQQLDPNKHKKVAMFCTGGIRCEKATALMLELGFEEVYHLQGGILKYLEEMPAQENQWDGECFVFDTRVAVDRDLAEGGYVQCHACRRPLSTEEMASPDYQEGVSCPRCINDLDEERAAGLRERQRQIELARERGDIHIGPKP